MFGQNDAENDETAVGDSAKADTSVQEKEEGLDARVDYSAEDSMRFDRSEGKVHLYGNAKVEYKRITLEAERIVFSFEDRIVEAFGVKDDSSGEWSGQPVFKEGEQEFDAEELRYNFETRKGLIKEVHTEQGDGDLYSEKTKKHEDGKIHVKKGRYTTCTLDEYYFRFNKAVVIPKDKIVSGPVNLVIGRIPTPLLLPFGYFPDTEKGKSGIVVPQYGESPNLGFFLQDGGYYWRFDPHLDTRITGDIYSKGSWGVNNLTRYKKRYKYNGNLEFSYTNIKEGEPELPEFQESKEFFVRWKHKQDPKARPNSNFSANVNIGTKDNFRNNLNSTSQDYVTNEFQSNIDYSKNWPNSPFNFNGSLRHNQNSQSGDMRLTLPELGFNVNRFYPLEGIGKDGSASKKWYEKIGVNYVGNFRNRINTQTRKLRADRLESIVDTSAKYGMRHRVDATSSFKPGFLSITPTLSVSDQWYLRTYRPRYDEGLEQEVTDTLKGFRNGLDPSANVDVTTKVYGMYRFLGEKQTSIRHVLTPNVGFTYRPSGMEQPEADRDGDGTLEPYDPFRGTVYGGPTYRSSGDLNFALINNFEGKYRPEGDSGETEKFQILDNLTFRSTYDIFKDSLNWSPLSISGRGSFLKFFNVRFQARFDPYAVNEHTGQRIDRFQQKVNGKLLRWQSGNLTFGGDLKQKNGGGGASTEGSTMEYVRRNPDAYVDFSIPWNLGFNYNLQANQRYGEEGARTELDQTIDFNGNFRITENWKVEFRSGYDPEAGELTYSRINIYRDLGCWEMSFRWVPFGRRRNYSFQINLASPLLKDMKLQKRANWYDRDVQLE